MRVGGGPGTRKTGEGRGWGLGSPTVRCWPGRKVILGGRGEPVCQMLLKSRELSIET